jgi:MFS family permease
VGGAAQPAKDPWSAVLVLGITQITAWGSIYYLFALVMEPLQASLGAANNAVVGAFSLALLLSGMLAPLVGGIIDRHGGRTIMAAGSVLGGVALCALAHVTSLVELYFVWALLGVSMTATLYEPAFAVLTQAFRANFRKAITALSLFGGFASTVFWPITALLIERYGWRNAVTILGITNLLICVPLHLFALPRRRPAPARPHHEAVASSNLRAALSDRTFYLLCAAFTANALVFSAMSVHMIAMLNAKGLTSVQAAFIGAMVGPMQVAGRIAEMLFGRLLSPSKVGFIAMGLLPVSLALFLVADGTVAMLALFALLYGTGNGVMTIVRGTIPAELYGRLHYGAINGAMASPVLVSKALGPLAASLLLVAVGGYGGVIATLAITAASSVVFFFLATRARRGTRYAT